MWERFPRTWSVCRNCGAWGGGCLVPRRITHELIRRRGVVKTYWHGCSAVGLLARTRDLTGRRGVHISVRMDSAESLAVPWPPRVRFSHRTSPNNVTPIIGHRDNLCVCFPRVFSFFAKLLTYEGMRFRAAHFVEPGAARRRGKSPPRTCSPRPAVVGVVPHVPLPAPSNVWVDVLPL